MSAHEAVFSSQQSQGALNFNLRNAIAQMQIDVTNAGNGFYPGADIAAWPIGLKITNRTASGSGCYDAASHTYGPACFDDLYVVATDTTVPLAHPDPNAGNQLTTASTLFATPDGTTTAAQLAAAYKTGDILLLVSQDGSQMRTVVLTKDAQVSGGRVKFEHNPTATKGTKDSNDPIDLFYLPDGVDSAAIMNKVGESFTSSDWILKLVPIEFKVDATDPSNPKLVRIITTTQAQETVAEQVIGFKVGASTYDSDIDFQYDPNAYKYEWTKIVAVRVTLIGRTPPITGSHYTNTFDGGPYRVQAVSTVINPRNLSMGHQ
jgi:hypothetical protein